MRRSSPDGAMGPGVVPPDVPHAKATSAVVRPHDTFDAENDDARIVPPSARNAGAQSTARA
jgi:hypothetical protein